MRAAVLKVGIRQGAGLQEKSQHASVLTELLEVVVALMSESCSSSGIFTARVPTQQFTVALHNKRTL